MTPNYLVDHEGQPETMNLVNNSLVNTVCDEINEEVWTRQGLGGKFVNVIVVIILVEEKD